MAFSTMAQSSTPRQMGPTLSMVQLKAIAPWRLTRRQVGRSPTVPQTPLGEIIEPRVSVPSEKPTRPAAVEEADPAEDPLEPRSYSPLADRQSVGQGLLVRPLNHRSP